MEDTKTHTANPFPAGTLVETTRELPFTMSDRHSHPSGIRFTVLDFVDVGSRCGAPTYFGLRVEDSRPFSAPADALRVVDESENTLPSPEQKETSNMDTPAETQVEPAAPSAHDTLPVFHGTPEDWWNQAEEITESHAAEKNLGDWYITWLRGTAGTSPAFRVATPSRPPNEAKRRAMAQKYNGDPISKNVRRLIKAPVSTPAWMTSEFVLADVRQGSAERGPWHRKPSGKWQLVTDGRVSVYDQTMTLLNPAPATFS